MPLKAVGTIEIPGSLDTTFDHGAFEPTTRRVFVAHTSRNCLQVIDQSAGQHLVTLEGFPEPAGVVAEDGDVLATNRGAASLAWITAGTLETRAVFDTGSRPNGVALVSRSRLAVVACIGDETHGPELQALHLESGQRRSIELPGRPRWCVVDRDARRIFLAIREPSMVLVARLPELDDVQHWMLPSAGAHGLDIDHAAGLLYVACDGGMLIELDTRRGVVRGGWPLAGIPDATFLNPTSGLVHVAIGKPGLVQSIEPRTGANTRCTTAPGAKTTALVVPNRLFVFSPFHRGILELLES
jgi:hypothetical protein